MGLNNKARQGSGRYLRRWVGMVGNLMILILIIFAGYVRRALNHPWNTATGVCWPMHDRLNNKFDRNNHGTGGR
jgi:hypothetical protein